MNTPLHLVLVACVICILVSREGFADAPTRVDTSALMGSPDPLPSMTLQRAFHLRFSAPVQPTHSGDGSSRIFVATQSGTVHVFDDDPNTETSKLFLDIRDRVINPGGDNGLFSIAFHPNYREKGEFFVVYGTRQRPKSTRVSRFRVSPTNPDEALKDSEEILLQIRQPWPDHNAACLAFGPDGYLYIALGDGGYSVQNGNAQDRTTLLGAMLRIDVDSRDPRLPYAVPPDNPLIASPTARPELWAWGLRAPWRFSFDRLTGDCWLGDNGQVEFEEINRIERGNNYGWMIREGLHGFDPSSADARGRPALSSPRQREPEHNRPPEFTDPIIEYDHSKGKSVVGGFVYRGKRFPDLLGAYIYGDYGNGNIWALRADGDQVLENKLIVRSRKKITSFGEDSDGELLVSAMDGFLYRLRRAPYATPKHFPAALSQTGLFESTENHRVTAGIVPYEVNVPLWSDGASKDRYIALPGQGAVHFDKSKPWKFPIGTVFIKTFTHGTSGERIETRLMVHSPRGWTGYTYRWNTAQTDALLLADGMIGELSGGDRWYFPSRNDCMLCHSEKSGFVLGGNTRQLNRQMSELPDSVNQIDRFVSAGLFHNPPQKTDSSFPAFPELHSQSISVSKRARAYLDVNCSTCHTPPGYTRIDLRAESPLNSTGMLMVVPEKPSVARKDSMLVYPGDPKRSELYLRMLHQGRGRMPNIASLKTDPQGTELIRQWIQSLR